MAFQNCLYLSLGAGDSSSDSDKDAPSSVGDLTQENVDLKRQVS